MLNVSLSRLISLLRNSTLKRVLDVYPNNWTKPKGSVLVSYLSEPLLWKAGDRRFLGHSNAWECVEIVQIFNRLGYSVDVISWKDSRFTPRKDYTAVVDIHRNLHRFAGPGIHKIFHVTGSNPRFSNNAESKRIQGIYARRGVNLKPRRRVSAEDLMLFERNMELADTVTLIGNEVTASTFPDVIKQKLHCVPATGSFLSMTRQNFEFSGKREFLWFNGFGAVHKGLDLTLEVFARNPDLVLHVVGPYQREHDFVEVYRHELKKCSNILSHGFVYPSSEKFQRITKNVVAVVSPSCSEGISTSAITCMQYGMVPILSENSGITLSPGMGYLLKENSLDEIESAVRAICDKTPQQTREMILEAQTYATKIYSRAQFTMAMENIITRSLS